jgi:hypothetical protein
VIEAPISSGSIETSEQGRTIYDVVQPVEAGRGLSILLNRPQETSSIDLEGNPYMLDQGRLRAHSFPGSVATEGLQNGKTTD